MSRYWSPIVHDLVPYVPGEQPKANDLVKLNTNENPFGPSPKVLDAIRSEVGDGLRLYPDPNAEQLKKTIAKYHQIDTSQVFVGNGSDEVLAHAFHALFQHEAPLLFPDITYSFYPVYCNLYQIAYKTIPLADDFSINIADYHLPNSGIIFPNPNAPTGRLLEFSEIEKLLQINTESVVVIDEAYIDFGGDTAISLVNRYPNLLVTQSLSKSRSLAGVRVGFAVGNPELIEALERVKDSFNSYPLDKLAIAGGVAAFEDEAYFEQTCQTIISSRNALAAELIRMGFEVIPSAANFIFTRHPQYDAADIAIELRERRVLIRHFKQSRIENYLRISIGTLDENTKLLSALGESLNSLIPVD